tara:strand:- start:76990 stop:78231 length:1242 start_codon:yes stop_codon:yes gene_type:complete
MTQIFFFILALISSAHAQDLDQFLRQEMNRFLMTSPQTIERPATEILVLGHELFRDRQLSGNNNISCHDCHHPMLGTGDAISLAVGEGGSFVGRARTQDQGLVVARHSPHLINLGHKENFEMFWDARVRIDRRTKELITPEEKLKDHPEITKHLDSALAAQTIFPILSPEEMRGKPGSNPLANLSDSIEIWDAVIEKLKKTKAPNSKSYVELFNNAFPNEKHNAGHMGKAMASFIGWRFQVNNTPFDRYLGGDNQALSDSEKQGLKIFMGKGRCAVCHHGQLLTNQMLMNVAVPPLHTSGASVDRGFRGRFAFKTPGLRNVAKTAPYMHNGVFQTLEEVIEHYDNVPQSLKTFVPSEQTHLPYQSRLVRADDPEILQDIEDDLIQPFLRRGLGLTQDEKTHLLKFLEISLTSP